jgi:hypothetical protein
MMSNKIVAATGAFLVAWVGFKLWLAPPKDVMSVSLMVIKGMTFGTLFYFGVAWLRDRLVAPRQAE